MIGVEEGVARAASDWVGIATLVTAILAGIAGVITVIVRLDPRPSDKPTPPAVSADPLAAEIAAEVYQGLVSTLRGEIQAVRATADADREALTERLDRVDHELQEARRGHSKCEQNLATERRERARMARRLQAAENRLADLGG